MPRSIEYLAADGVTADAAQSKDWGTLIAGATGATKYWLRNDGDVALGAGFTLQLIDQLLNGGVGIFKHALDTATVRPPYGGAAVVGGSGGVFGATATWYFVVSRLNASGATQPSVEFSFAVTDIAKKVNLSWLIPGGPADTSVKVYASTTQGSYGASSLIATLGAGATSYIWDGTAPAAGQPATANTTAGAAPAYGTAPTLGVADLLIGALAVGEARAFWVGEVIPGSAASVTYRVNVHPVEL